MNRILTLLLLFCAVGLAVSVAVLRSCAGAGRDDGFVMSLQPANVKSVTLRAGAEKFSLVRSGGNWEVRVGDMEDLADATQAETLLALASRLIAYDRVPASEIRGGDDLGEFGLKSSKRWLEFEGPQKIKLLLGKEAAADGRIYARLDGENSVFVIDDDIAKFAEKAPQEYRDRRLTRAVSGQIDRFVISGESGEIEVARTPSGWQITKPLSAPADESEVGRYLGSLLSLNILSFVGPDSGNLGLYGLSDGKNQVALYTEGRERPMVLRFGAPAEGAPGEICAQFTPRDSVVRLPGAARALIEVRPETFRDKRVLPINQDFVDMIRVSSDGREISLRRDGEKWEIAGKDGERRPASSAAIARLFEALAGPSTLEFTSAPPPQTPPSRSVAFYSVLSENSAEEAAGEHQIARADFYPPAGGRALCIVSGQSGGLIVPEALAASISSDASVWAVPTGTTKP